MWGIEHKIGISPLAMMIEGIIGYIRFLNSKLLSSTE
jgi:hypothetical protein